MTRSQRSTTRTSGVLACLPLAALRAAVLVFLRIDYAGGFVVETVTGEDADASSKYPWVLIHRGHMRLLVPPSDVDGKTWLSQLARPPLDTPSHGWEFYIDRAREEPATVGGDVARGCRSCRAARQRAEPRPRAVGASDFGWWARTAGIQRAATATRWTSCSFPARPPA